MLSAECHVLGWGFPVWADTVADLVNMAPADDAAIFDRAAADPVRGPLALYTQVAMGIPPTVVSRLMVGLLIDSICSD
jgi:hypothetical protein